MDSNRWQQLRSLVRQAGELPTAEQEAWLRDVCADDAELLAESQALLAQMQGATAFDARVQSAIGSEADAMQQQEQLGQTLGAYRLIRKLDEGGMGTVYLAERADEAYSSLVAIKQMRQPGYSEEAARRFASERQILANLHHPYICQLLDGGTSADGQPYLVMEYIDGVDIESYCNVEQLSVRERINLFRKVCEAVDYLHRNLVVHRDIKPSNILIQDGIPKLLDFGIAKPLAETSADLTAVGQRALTPIFASPEQVRGEMVTTQTDVYGLGVVLYRLLSGRHPYAPKDQSLRALEDAVCDVEPLPPSLSTTQTELGEHAPVVPELQSTDQPSQRRRALAGDLDNIVLKCLHKDPSLRYPSALAIEQDLSRYLNLEPVQARPAGAWYRMSKFVQRNRALVFTSVGMAMLLATSVGFYTWQLAQERDALNTEVRKTQAVSEFLTELFGAADPNRSGGKPVTASELLAKGAEQVQRDLQQQPRIRAEMLFAIADSYARMRQYQTAGELFAQGFELVEQPSELPEYSLSRWINSYGLLQLELGDLDAAKERFHTALARERRFDRAQSKQAYNSRIRLADIARELGDHDTARRELDAVVTELRSLRDPREDQLASVFNALQVQGHVLRETGEWDAAERGGLEALTVARQRFPDGAHDTIGSALNNLGNLYRTQSRYDEALRYYNEALTVWRAVFGKDTIQVGRALANRSSVQMHLGRFDDALVEANEALQIFTDVLGEDHPQVAFLKENIGAVLLNLDRHEEAFAIYESSLAQVRKIFGSEHPEYATSLSNYAGVLLELERFAEAEPASREAVAGLTAAFGAEHHAVAAAQLKVAQALRGRGDLAASVTLLRENLVVLDQIYTEPSLPQLNALEELGRTLRMTEDLEGSKQALEKAVSLAQSIQGETVQTWRTQLELAQSLFALEQHGAAQALLREVADAYAPNEQRSPALERQLAELTALFGG